MAYNWNWGVFLQPTARYGYLLEYPEGGKGKVTLGQAVEAAMKAIEADKTHLAGVLPKTYQGFNARLLKELLKAFAIIPDDLEGDAFGKIYEYFLAEFAMTGGPPSRRSSCACPATSDAYSDPEGTRPERAEPRA